LYGARKGTNATNGRKLRADPAPAVRALEEIGPDAGAE
jgi:hypothetical protein